MTEVRIGFGALLGADGGVMGFAAGSTDANEGKAAGQRSTIRTALATGHNK
jgi:hypothetical protein